MKWTFLALVLVNVLYLVWQASEPAAAPPVTAKSVDTAQVPSLTLVTPEMAAQIRAEMRQRFEAAKKSRAASKPKPTPKSKPKPVTVVACHEAGPFKTTAAAGALAGKLKKLHIKVSTEKRQQKVQSGYWVILPPAESARAAASNLRRLKDRGLNDVMQMTRGDARNAISLGIYTFEKTANQRMAQVTALGFEPRIVPRYDFKPIYWLRFKTEDVKGSERAWQGVLKNYPKISHKTLACE